MSPRVRSAARWGFGLVVLAVVISLFDVDLVRRRLAGADVTLAAMAIGGLVAVHLVGALSWRRLTSGLAGIVLDERSTVGRYYAAQALGTITPGNLGADVYRITTGISGADQARLAGPIVVQRLTSVAAMLLLAGLGASILPIDHLGMAGIGLLGLGIGAGLAVAGLCADPGRLPGTVGRIGERLGIRSDPGRRRQRFAVALRDGVGFGLAFHGISLLLGWVLVAAVDPGSVARPVEVLAALSVARLSLALPLSPSGIGIQEGALTVLFVGLGLSPDVALAASLLNRVALLLTAVLGSVVLLAGSRANGVASPRSA